MYDLGPVAINTVSGMMGRLETDRAFTGSIPAVYETYLVPLIFESYATDLVSRLAKCAPARVLELAAGTGVVTRLLAAVLPDPVSIVATDLNPSMIGHPAMLGTSRPVDWRQADAMALPFDEGSFDAVICQFGVMFFPDKRRAFAEARRVLAPGGVLLFNVWDRIEENEFADTITTALEAVFPADPPRFLVRTPHGYHDKAIIESDLLKGGFLSPPAITTLAARSLAGSPRVPAIAFCKGTRLRNEIEARDASRLCGATDLVSEAIARRFGPGPVDGQIQAHVVMIEQ